jgi:hypothetical protein
MRQKIQAFHPLPIDSDFIKTEIFLDELLEEGMIRDGI